jgi:co-chaperonin GroES (HSP10)
MNISPVGDVVVIRRSAPQEVSAGGIHLIWDENYREDIGVVYASGPKATLVKAGDKILFSTNGHQITKVDGQELVVLREKSIIAVIEGDNVQAGTYKEDRQMAGIE